MVKRNKDLHKSIFGNNIFLRINNIIHSQLTILIFNDYYEQLIVPSNV